MRKSGKRSRPGAELEKLINKGDVAQTLPSPGLGVLTEKRRERLADEMLSNELEIIKIGSDLSRVSSGDGSGRTRWGTFVEAAGRAAQAAEFETTSGKTLK